MTYTAIEIPRFGGLNVADDPQEVGYTGAIDLRNIEFNHTGRIRQRDGYTQLHDGGSGRSYHSLLGAYFPVNVHSRIFGYAFNSGAADYRAYAIDTAGTVQTTSLALSGAATSAFTFTQFGTATAEAVYGPIGTSTTSILEYDAATTAFTYPATGYAGALCAVQPYDNRMVLAQTFDVTHGSRVRFSDPGDPKTYGANNYVDLNPHDGSTVCGIVAHQGNLFVFKQNKFAVFYGNSTDSGGNPVFNYRWVDTGIGLARTNACCSSPNGVYFVGYDGIYLTNGGPPQKVSRELDPLFRYESLNHWSNGTMTASSPSRLMWLEGRLYFTSRDSTSNGGGIWVLTPGVGWSYWNTGASGPMTMWQDPNQVDDYTVWFAGAGTTPRYIRAITRGLTTDNLAAITSYYGTGFFSLGEPGQEAVLREMLIDGSYAVTVQVTVNDIDALDTATTVSLGDAATTAQGRHRKAYRGRTFRMYINGAPGNVGQWEVKRLVLHGRDQRAGSAVTA